MKNLNEMAQSVTWTKCKVCCEELQRYKGAPYPNGKDFKYVNQDQREWSGRVCPDCHSTRTAKRQKKIRLVKKLYV